MGAPKLGVTRCQMVIFKTMIIEGGVPFSLQDYHIRNTLRKWLRKRVYRLFLLRAGNISEIILLDSLEAVPLLSTQW